MKNRIFLLSFTLFIMIGCNTEESNILNTIPDIQKLKNAPGIITMISLDNKVEFPKTISLDAFGPDAFNIAIPKTFENSTNGNITIPFFGGYDFNFCGVQNNSGIHGNASFSGPLLNVRMTADCLVFQGKEVVYGGIITDVFYQDEMFCDWGICLTPGIFIAFKVIDNGEDFNAKPDEVAPVFWVGTESLCQYLSTRSWDWLGLNEVKGQIQVK